MENIKDIAFLVTMNFQAYVRIVFFIKPQRDFTKAVFFISISLVSIFTTVYLILGTFALIKASPSKGPVHWHADFLMFQCGKEIDLIDQTGFSNRGGTPTVHEHGDKRVHIEGIPETVSTASLKNFMQSIGGYINTHLWRVPTHDGMVEIKNGDLCRGSEGVIQVFVWFTEKGVATQKKVESFPDYTISKEAIVPPGDCIIFDFDVPKEQTEYICEQYEAAEERGDLRIGWSLTLSPIP